MPPTNPSSATVSPAASSPDLPPPGGLCAIHQPNLFPRLTTLAKLFAADYWIVLDNVQFSRRDYQHRTRLATLGNPQQHQWLTIPTHLPHGRRRTAICQALIADPALAQRRCTGMLRQHYGSSPHWPTLEAVLPRVLDLFETTDKTAVVAENSTHVLLQMVGWKGQSLRSSQLPARPGRSQRLVDLAAVTGARSYLCGTGGMTYLDTSLFTARSISVTPFTTPATDEWEAGHQISAVRDLMRLGPTALADELRTVAIGQPKPLPVA